MRADLASADRPFVSCIIPFLDAERHLGQAIRSVLAQTYHRWELVLVDDGSTDESRKIAEDYRSEHEDRIKILHHAGNRNLGKSVSRNLGVRASTGELIAFLDADDVWLPGKLDTQVRILREQPIAAATYGPVRYWYSWTGRPRDRHRDLVSLVGFEPDALVLPPRVLIRLLEVEARRGETISPYPSSFVFRRSAFDDVGGFEEDFPQVYDDVIFFAKLLARHSVFISREVCTLYRLPPDERHSTSYLAALEKGHWRAEATNPAEGAFLARLREYLSRERLLSGRLALAFKLAALPYENPTLGVALSSVRRAAGTLRGAARKRLRAFAPGLFRGSVIPPGEVRWGDFGAAPIDQPERIGGRGGAIPDILFAEFATLHAASLQGKVGEIGDDALARRVVGRTRCAAFVIPYTALDRRELVALEREAYACVIAHDVLRFSLDPLQTLEILASFLKLGGILLTSLTCLAPVLPGEDDRWRFTLAGTRALFDRSKRFELLEAVAVGDLKMSIAVLNGLGTRDFDAAEIESRPSAHPVQIMVKARKA